jgi:predicted MPP superfamily phosphohydrolase
MSVFGLINVGKAAGPVYSCTLSVFLLFQMLIRFLIFFLIVAAIEIYFLQAIKTFTRDFNPGLRTVFLYAAYSLTGITLGMMLLAMIYPPPNWNNSLRLISATIVVLVLCKLLGMSFLIIDDLIRLGKWTVSLFQAKPALADVGNKITRSKFLSQATIAFTVLPAIGFVYGMVRGAYKYKVHRVKVLSKNLPDAFEGYRIVQISDIHTGSFTDNTALNRAFDIVMEQKPDLILFTGDLVNNKADETKGFEEVYRKLKAPHGVFSVLGNHDYGDYVNWESMHEKKQNLESLKKVHADAGWTLLMNEHVALEKDGEKIALLGIENWGGNMHFPKYGKLEDAYRGTENYSFRMLMSHDPSHWGQQVLKEYGGVDLTLSGHTHGMQLGIEIPGFKWSPVKYFYKQWAGLYQSGEQFLYVNRGLGFLGYPGRLGIWPEITVLELAKA